MDAGSSLSAVHWLWRSRSVWGRVIAALGVLATLVSCQTSSAVSVVSGTPSPVGKAIVTGGLVGCSAPLPCPYNAAPYVAGIVTVLAGHVNGHSTGCGTSTDVLPTTVVTQQSVTTYAKYRFVLDPGSYVLQARFPPPSKVAPFTSVTLRAGDNLRVDIPDGCPS